MLMDFAQFIGRGYGAAWRGILFRRHYPDLEEIEVKSKKYFYRIFPEAHYNKSEHRWTWPSGEELLFRYADKPDDYWNYHGHEYPWIGWDELTAWANDELYMTMMTVCRSSDPNVPRHYRATCNPYGPGHNWVKLRHIDPSPRGRIAIDEQGRERVTIHGSIYENLILQKNDPGYLANLKAQAGARRAAWLEGDWDIVAGGMFDDIWDGNIHVVAPFRVPLTWRLDRSFDWGSARPYSVGFWAESDGCDITLPGGTARSTQRGDLFRIAEMYGWTGKPNEGTRELAVEVARKVVNFQQILNRPINPGPADSSIFSNENGNSIAGDMEKVGVRWEPANKQSGSRVNGWELMRERLKNSVNREGPGLYIFDTCRQFIRTVPVLPRDSKNPDDVDSEVEDHCLAGDTLVVTSKGNERIGDLVGTSGLLLTAGGYWTEYENCRLTRKNTQIFRITFEDDSFIICTGDHKILTAANQWKDTKAWKSESYHQDDRSFRASHITCADTTSKIKVSDFIEQFGNFTTDLSRKGATSIISTETEPTTTFSISNFSRVAGTFQNITLRETATRMFQRLRSLLHNGIRAQKVLNGIGNNINSIVERPYTGGLPKLVGIAAGNSSEAFDRYIAQITANRPIDAKQKPTTSSGAVPFVGKSSWLISTIQARPAHSVAVASLGVKRVDPAGFSDVYCLNARLTHCFVLSNGVIVHNCADEARYRCLTKRHTMTVRQAG